MNDECQQKRGKPLFKYVVMLIAVLLLCSFLFINYRGVVMCRELKPVNNLDELLYQFYVNLDSDCLFQIPTAQLERIWDIKIADRDRLKPGQSTIPLINSSDFALKTYNSEKDSFYVERINRGDSIMFRIVMTNAYSEKHATLFPDGNFPKLLPTPSKKFSPHEVYYGFPPKTRYYPKIPGVYSELGSYIYYWESTDKTREMHIFGVSNSAREIIVHNGLSPAPFVENLELN